MLKLMWVHCDHLSQSKRHFAFFTDYKYKLVSFCLSRFSILLQGFKLRKHEIIHFLSLQLIRITPCNHHYFQVFFITPNRNLYANSPFFPTLGNVNLPRYLSGSTQNVSHIHMLHFVYPFVGHMVSPLASVNNAIINIGMQV